MPTYFIKTTLPLSDADRAVFAYHHSETTGNQLSVMHNVAGTQCLVKVNCNHAIDEVLPPDFVPLEVFTDIDAVRTLLGTADWQALTL